jgi:shikimate dehydrogenase
MSPALNGATRLYFIVGDPIAQVKSPAGVTEAFAAQGRNAVCVPAHVAPEHLAAWLAGTSLAQNIVTVPHKFAACALCETTTPRAALLQAANVLRRRPGGGWHGDMVDGIGFVQAMRAQGCEPRGRRALLVGAGGAGSAIAQALAEAGVAELAVHDADATRRDALLQRVAGQGPGRVAAAGGADPAGFDIAVNATPAGMQAGDPLPIYPTRLAPGTFVGCAITAPAVTPLIAAARAAGCATLTGTEMFACVRDRMVEFLLAQAT